MNNKEWKIGMFWTVFWVVLFVIIIIFGISIVSATNEEQTKKEIEEVQRKLEKRREYEELEYNVLKHLNFSNWSIVSYFDDNIIVKSRQTLEKYDDIKYFKENREKFELAENTIKRKVEIATILRSFIEENEYKSHLQYRQITEHIGTILINAKAYRVKIKYISSAGNYLDSKEIVITQHDINRFKEDQSLLMSKVEYNKYIKEQQKEALNQKHHEYYDNVNIIIDYANDNKDSLIIKGSQKQIDDLIDKILEKTVNGIKKIKSIDSEEWDIIGKLISNTKNDIENIVNENKKVLEYYESLDFLKIKETCEALMSSKREFNEYISEKVQSISKLFGTRVVRTETINNDEFNYVRPYKKTITPFTAELSANVFANAENKQLDYVVKYFYPNKNLYPEQIQKLHLLIEELETLKDAKQIIENYKLEYKQYLDDVPDFIMKNDKTGFYSRLGFANVDESTLTIEYKFSYTSGGGMAQRSFTVPMTEDTIVELIETLESKLTMSAFTKEQRKLMTSKLREFIKKRDNYTCCNCGNSIHNEPNLLLEIDHIIPVSKGGCTTEDNLQTLCWKCNRAKSDKIIS